MTDAKAHLDLRSLVSTVRDELEAMDLERRSRDRPALFQLAEMELELHFVVEKKGAAKGKAAFWVVSLV